MVPDRRARTGNPERRAEPLSGGVGAHQGADPPAVDGRHVPEVHEQISRAVAKQGLHALLELFGGAAGDERLLGGQHDAAADRILSNRHVTGLEDYNMRLRGSRADELAYHRISTDSADPLWLL